MAVARITAMVQVPSQVTELPHASGAAKNKNINKKQKNLTTALFFFLFFFLSRAAPVAYGGSQAWGPIGTIAGGLHQSHSNAGSEPHL